MVPIENQLGKWPPPRDWPWRESICFLAEQHDIIHWRYFFKKDPPFFYICHFETNGGAQGKFKLITAQVSGPEEEELKGEWKNVQDDKMKIKLSYPLLLKLVQHLYQVARHFSEILDKPKIEQIASKEEWRGYPVSDPEKFRYLNIDPSAIFGSTPKDRLRCSKILVNPIWTLWHASVQHDTTYGLTLAFYRTCSRCPVDETNTHKIWEGVDDFLRSSNQTSVKENQSANQTSTKTNQSGPKLKESLAMIRKLADISKLSIELDYARLQRIGKWYYEARSAARWREQNTQDKFIKRFTVAMAVEYIDRFFFYIHNNLHPNQADPADINIPQMKSDLFYMLARAMGMSAHAQCILEEDLSAVQLPQIPEAAHFK